MTVEHFDQWYADMRHHPEAKDTFVQALLGLPIEIQSTSVLGWSGLLEVRDLLALGPGDLLVDMACGRGGYGMWLARQSGARVCGVDFSTVAIEMARARVGLFGLSAEQAEFRVGTLVASGIEAGSADALLCVDAIQFADEIAAAAGEFRRVLCRGGRAVVTSWEPKDREDESLTERIRRVDLATQLVAGGLTEVVVEERPDWTSQERRLWSAAVDIDPGDDPALAALRDEALQVLPMVDRVRRVVATATAP